MPSHDRMVLYTLALLSACLPPAAVTILFSQLSSISPRILLALSGSPASIYGFSMHTPMVLVTSAAVAILVAARRGKAGEGSASWRWWASWWFCVVLGLASATLAVPFHPCFAIALLSGSGWLWLFWLRRTYYQEVEPALWFHVSSMCFSCAALICVALWFTFIAVGFPGRNSWTDWSDAFRSLVEQKQLTWKMAFVAWCAPLAMAGQLGLAALLCWMRRQHNILHDNLDDSGHAPNSTWIISSVKQLSVWIGAFVLLAWLHAALSATTDTKYDQEREDLRDEVLGLGVLVFVTVFFWTADTLGPLEVQAAAQDSKVVQETQKMIQGDWSKAALLLMAALPMSAGALLDCIEKRLGIRRDRPLLWFVKNWCWSSVVVKAVWLGLLYIFVAVGFTKFTSVLLALINESLAGWPLYSVSVAMLVIGFLIFLLPIAPGPPIYVVMGIVIVSSALRQGWTFGQGVVWATLTAFVMKMSFTFAAKKWIGEPLSQNDTIRHYCELHTPYMRAAESILKAEGLTVAKVTLLVGGPDWPVAVLSGILRVPESQVLLGTCPVLLQSVFPCVLAGALMLSGTDDDRNDFGMAEVTLAIAGVIQAASAAVAFFYVQETLEKKYEELTQAREEDRSILELEAFHEHQSRCFWKQLSWKVLPCWLRSALVLSLVAIEVSIILLTAPLEKMVGLKCFKPFGLNSSVSKDLGGNPLAIVLPTGWVALAFAAWSFKLLMAFYIYAKSTTVEDLPEESEPLISDAQDDFLNRMVL